MLLAGLATRAGAPNLSGYDRMFSLPNQQIHRIVPLRCTTIMSLLSNISHTTSLEGQPPLCSLLIFLVFWSNEISYREWAAIY